MDSTESSPSGVHKALGGRGVFLVIILALIAFNLLVLAKYGATRGGYGNLIVGIMLLLNHLSFRYAKTGRWGRTLRTAALVWLALGFVYLIYAARITFHK